MLTDWLLAGSFLCTYVSTSLFSVPPHPPSLPLPLPSISPYMSFLYIFFLSLSLLLCFPSSPPIYYLPSIPHFLPPSSAHPPPSPFYLSSLPPFSLLHSPSSLFYHSCLTSVFPSPSFSLPTPPPSPVPPFTTTPSPLIFLLHLHLPSISFHSPTFFFTSPLTHYHAVSTLFSLSSLSLALPS